MAMPFCHEGVCSQAASIQEPHGESRQASSGSGQATEEDEEDDDDALRRHFLSDIYAAGSDLNDLEAQDAGYVLENTEMRVPVYRHEESNVCIWRQALRLALPGEVDMEVFFHYTSASQFHEVTTAAIISPSAWASLKQDSLEGGLAVYAARREPSQLSSAYGTCAAAGGGTMGRLPWWVADAEFCIPLLVPAHAAFNADFPEDGCSPIKKGSPPHRGRDLWIVRFADEAGALLNAAVDNEHRFRRILRTSEAELGATHRETLDAAGYLAYLLDASGKLDEAEPLYRRALAGYEAWLGWEHPETLRSASNLAAMLQAQGRLAEAEPLSRKALHGLEAKFGARHPDTVASVGNLAHLLSSKGDLEEAEGFFRRLLVWREARLGPDHLDTVACIRDLASLLIRLERPGEAVFLERKALKQYEAALGPEHPETLRVVDVLGSLLEDRGELVEAENLRRRLLVAHTARFGPQHQETLAALSGLAKLLWRRGDLLGAEPLVRRTALTYESQFGPRHPDTLRSQADHEALLREIDQAEGRSKQPQQRNQRGAVGGGSGGSSARGGSGVAASAISRRPEAATASRQDDAYNVDVDGNSDAEAEASDQPLRPSVSSGSRAKQREPKDCSKVAAIAAPVLEEKRDQLIHKDVERIGLAESAAESKATDAKCQGRCQQGSRDLKDGAEAACDCELGERLPALEDKELDASIAVLLAQNRGAVADPASSSLGFKGWGGQGPTAASSLALGAPVAAASGDAGSPNLSPPWQRGDTPAEPREGCDTKKRRPSTPPLSLLPLPAAGASALPPAHQEMEAEAAQQEGRSLGSTAPEARARLRPSPASATVSASASAAAPSPATSLAAASGSPVAPLASMLGGRCVAAVVWRICGGGPAKITTAQPAPTS